MIFEEIKIEKEKKPEKLCKVFTVHPKEKINQLYLDQIGHNGTEKFGDLKELIIDDKLPKVNGKVKILEIGVGGGETIKKLQDQIGRGKEFDIIGIDISHSFANNFKKKTNSKAVVADAGLIPFKNDSLSAINASAIMHEVSSYGVTVDREGKKIFGAEAVEQSLDEIKRCLSEDGVFIYRDLACPEDKMEIKKVDYIRKSWQYFIGEYLPILSRASRDVLPSLFDGFNLSNNEDGITLQGTAQLHREIQRHYITFRDYFRKKVFPEMGVNVKEEEWVKKEEGEKQHLIEISGLALKEYAELKGKDVSNKETNLLIKMISNEYDNFTDRLIEVGFEKEISNFYDEWFRREGSEIYTYLNSDEIKKIAKKPDDEGSVLIVEKEKMIPRYYYQRYLNKVIKNPEFEGKQIINFVKKYNE